ncbi:MAG: phenylalanine--tRNA ligase subunit beta [Patescibacteria group bacterium]|nr:MAG: phenylalanine--tRNA ligase subunit beta [Patescibacteria group bacterium]
MLVPYSWLKDFVSVRKPAEKVAADLSLATIGVEEVRRQGREDVLNLEVTYNRGDLLSIAGVAKELAALYNLEFRGKEKRFTPPKDAAALKVRCPSELAKTYTLTKISDLSYRTAPKIVQERLEAAGMRTINLWADLTNYLMLEYGQPFHAFDAEKVGRRDPTLTIEVRRAKNKEKIKTLDGLDHELSRNDIVIADRKGPIAVAGVMGSEDTEVDEGTTEILLEAAIFDPILIRRTARKLGLRSEASGRFEHYLSPENLYISLNKVIHLYQVHGKGQVTGFVALGKEKTELQPIVLTQEKLKTVSGVSIPISQARQYLKLLGFKVMSSDQGLLCWPPHFRGDLSIPEDLVEEVLRLHGYGNLPAQPLQTTFSGVPPIGLEFWRDLVTHLFANWGFNEVKTYPFVSTKTRIHLGGEELLRLKNPISAETEYLRPSLFLSLLEVAQKNAPRFAEGKIYELEKVYPAKNGEHLSFGAAVWGAKDPFLTLKGYLETQLSKAHAEAQFKPVKSTLWHPTRSAGIQIDHKVLGIIGEIHPHLADAFNLTGTAVLEINFEEFTKLARSWGKFTPISPYPEIHEDFSFLLSEKYSLGELIGQIREASNLVREVVLMDRYQIPKGGERSITLRVMFQSSEKGLSSEDIKPIRKKIQSTIQKNKGVLRS